MIVRSFLFLLSLELLTDNCAATSKREITLNVKDIDCETTPKYYLDESLSYDVVWSSSEFKPPEPCGIQFIGRGSIEDDRYRVCVRGKSFNIKDCNVTVVYGEKAFTCTLKPPKSCGDEGKYFEIGIRSVNGFETVDEYPSGIALQVTASKTYDSRSPVNNSNSEEKTRVIAGVVAGMVFVCLLFVAILVIVIIIKTKKPKPSMQQLQAERRRRNKMLQEQSRAEAYRYRQETEQNDDSEPETEKVKYIHVAGSNIELREGIDNLQFEKDADDRSEPDGVSDTIKYPYQESSTDHNISLQNQTDVKVTESTF